MYSPHDPETPSGSFMDGFTYAMTTLRACLICGSRKIAVLGAFIPDDPRLWFTNLRPNHTRMRFYKLCHRCLKKSLKSKGALVEQRFLEADRARSGERAH